MLEDESGRIRLVGECLKSTRLVTGVIVGALGMETPNGDFEVKGREKMMFLVAANFGA